MKRIKILRLITWLPQGGIERKIVSVLPRLNRDVFEPYLCCLRERGPLADELEQQGVPVHVVPFSSRLDPIGLWKLHRILRQLSVDIVHAHMYRANTPATVLSILGEKVRVIGHYHNVDTWETWRQRQLDAFLARRRHLNLAVSDAVRRNVIENLSLPEEKIATLHNGVDTEEFRPVSQAEKELIRQKLGLPREAIVVIMVARFVSQKNHRFVIEHASELIRDYPNLIFLFAGSGPLEDELKQLSAKYGLTHHTVFLGSRDDIPRLLAASDISILPSSREGFSNTVLESMATGLPVVASDVGGAREIIDHGVNGLVLAMETTPAGPLPKSVEFIRLLRRLAGSPELCRRLGVSARQTALKFSLDVMVRKTESLYLKLMGER
ncbi:MAG: glycosyltransferase [Candidatus Sumerlaeaceae bacterium]|nr:glycosyltransferase [Candidatus Sumerlaeaceae bacterium]